jgi:four helix bundle protein
MCTASRVQFAVSMTADAESLRTRTKKFTLDVLAFVRTLPADDECREIAGQLRRAAGGVGANYRATCRARSRPEFIARINVALEEADQCGFWLEILAEGKLSSGARLPETTR